MTTADRRNRVTVGALPQDFLQLPQSQQVVADAQAAAYMQYGGQQPMAGGFMPPHVRGKLSITVVQAKLNKNYGLMKMDTYCRIRLGHHVLETTTAQGAGKAPNWNKNIACYLPDGVDNMYIELFDERTFTADDRIAWAHVPIGEEVLHGETSDKWYTLSGRLGDDKEGSIQIVISFVDMSQVAAPRQQVVVGGGMPVMPMMYQVVPQGYMMPGQYQQPMQQQPQVPQEPMITDTDVNQIKELFPDVEADVVRSVLEANRGNKDATINALLQMQAD